MKPIEKFRKVVGILKDKTSIIKASLAFKPSTSFIQTAVLHATTHEASNPPSEKTIATILSLGEHSHSAACACIALLTARLHKTRNASVALKCLYTMHNIIVKGCPLLKDQLFVSQSSGGSKYINMSTFRDQTDVESWELSAWVRWYARILEENMIASRVLGDFSAPSCNTIKNKDEKFSALSNSDLLEEIDKLVSFFELICDVPDSLYFLKNNIIHEVIMMVSEEYRIAQRNLSQRVMELGERMQSLSLDELTRSLRELKSVQDCRERLLLVFANRKRNDEFWDLISQNLIEITVLKEKQEKWIVTIDGKSNGYIGQIKLKEGKFGAQCLTMDLPPLALSPVG